MAWLRRRSAWMPLLLVCTLLATSVCFAIYTITTGFALKCQTQLCRQSWDTGRIQLMMLYLLQLHSCKHVFCTVLNA